MVKKCSYYIKSYLWAILHTSQEFSIGRKSHRSPISPECPKISRCTAKLLGVIARDPESGGGLRPWKLSAPELWCLQQESCGHGYATYPLVMTVT